MVTLLPSHLLPQRTSRTSETSTKGTGIRESIKCYDLFFIGNLLVALRMVWNFEPFSVTIFHRHSGDVILPRSFPFCITAVTDKVRLL